MGKIFPSETPTLMALPVCPFLMFLHQNFLQYLLISVLKHLPVIFIKDILYHIYRQENINGIKPQHHIFLGQNHGKFSKRSVAHHRHWQQISHLLSSSGPQLITSGPVNLFSTISCNNDTSSLPVLNTYTIGLLNIVT